MLNQTRRFDGPRESPGGITPQFRWNEKSGRYINNRGRFVPGSDVREAIDEFIAKTGEEAAELTEKLRVREVSLATWQKEMAKHIKNVHLANAAAAKGGWAEMTQSDYGRVGRVVRDQYVFLRDRAIAIQRGETPLDGRLTNYAETYMEAGRGTFHLFEQLGMSKRGYDLEASVLEAGAKHCNQCPSEAGKGFVPIGQLVPIGQRECGPRCKCKMRYKNSLTGETRE